MGAVSDRRTMDRQPRISWLKPKKKKKRKRLPSSGCSIRFTRNRKTNPHEDHSKVGEQWAGLFSNVIVRYCKGLSPKGPSDTTGLQKANAASNSSPKPTSNAPNLSRSALSLWHEPARKLSGLVNGETPTASLSAVPTVCLSAGLRGFCLTSRTSVWPPVASSL